MPGHSRTWRSGFGITVISNGINENDREKREVMLAAGEQPDIGGWWGNPLDHFEAGLTRAIPKAWIREYAPNLASSCPGIADLDG